MVKMSQLSLRPPKFLKRKNTSWLQWLPFRCVFSFQRFTSRLESTRNSSWDGITNTQSITNSGKCLFSLWSTTEWRRSLSTSSTLSTSQSAKRKLTKLRRNSSFRKLATILRRLSTSLSWLFGGTTSYQRQDGCRKY